MKLSEVAQEVTEVEVVVGSSSFQASIRPGAVTPALIAQLGEAEKGNDAAAVADAIADAICEIVAAWDLQEDDDSMVELTPARVKRLPMGLLMAVIDTGKEAFGVGEARPATSAAG